MNQEANRPQVVVEKGHQRPERLGLAPAVVDSGVPGTVGFAEMGLQFAQEFGIAGEIGRIRWGEEVAEERQAGHVARRIAHRHAASHA